MSNLIEKNDINIVKLSLELEKAVIQHELQDDEVIYVNEDGFFPFWICILEHRSFVCLSTHTFFRKSSTRQQQLEFCNRLNRQYYMVTAHSKDETLRIDHILSFEDGIFQETFIRACRKFSRTIEIALMELDPNNELVLQLGQTESEEAESE